MHKIRNNIKRAMSMGMLSLMFNYSTGSGRKLTFASTDVWADSDYVEAVSALQRDELDQIERQFGNWGFAPPFEKTIHVLKPDFQIMRIKFARRALSSEEGVPPRTIAYVYSIVHVVFSQPSQRPSPRFELIYKGKSLGNRPLIHSVLFRAIPEMASNPFPEVATFPQVFPQLAFPQLIAFLGQQTEPPVTLANVLLNSVSPSDPQQELPLLQEALQAFAIMNRMGGILQDPVFLPILAQTLMSVLVHSGTGALPALLSPTRGGELSAFSPIPRCFPMQMLLRSLYSPSIMPLALCFPEALAMAITGPELFSPGLSLAAVLMPLLAKQFPAFAPTIEISQLLSILDPVVGFLYNLRNQDQESAIALVRAFAEVLFSPDTEELLTMLRPYPQALALELVARMLFQAACPPSEYQSVLGELLGDAGMDNPASAQLVMFAIQQLNAIMCDPDYSKLTGGHPLIGPLEGCYTVGISGGGRIVYAIDHPKRQVVLVGITPTHDYSSLASPARAILDLLQK
ncbi:MAG: hypothetical protein LBD60_02075 [Puniceicoccales bacterium]|nr:hypothetical protein [Puniceicoccales bacterium]